MSNEAIILKKLKSNDMSCFDELYENSKKNVYFAIYAIFRNEEIAKDLMQDTYISFLNNVSKIKDGTPLVPYLVSIAKNLSLNYYKKNKRELEYVSSTREEAYYLDQTFQTDLIDKIKQILTEKEFMVFILKVLGDYSFKEISQLKNIPIGTLTWTYQEARKKLQKELGGMKNG
ncbi:MAG: RNA polymerase sigma factor [Bacilli bacterium]